MNSLRRIANKSKSRGNQSQVDELQDNWSQANKSQDKSQVKKSQDNQSYVNTLRDNYSQVNQSQVNKSQAYV